MKSKNIFGHFSQENILKVQTYNDLCHHVILPCKDMKSMNFDNQIQKNKILFLVLGYLISAIIFYSILNMLKIDNNEYISLISVAFYYFSVNNVIFEKVISFVKRKYCKVFLGFDYQS